MHACTLAFAYVMEPCSIKNNRRTLAATVLFATAAIVGWPFSLALAIPFVYEELFVVGSDTAHKDTASVLRYRWIRFITYTLLAGLVAVRISKWLQLAWLILHRSRSLASTPRHMAS